MNLKWIGLVFVLILIGLILWYIFLRPFPSGPPLFVDHADRISVDELVEKYGEVGNITLPIWMPGEAQLVEILLFGETAILVYGDEGLVIGEQDDLLKAKATISIKPTRPAMIHGAGVLYGKEGILVGDLRVVITEHSIPGRPRWRKRLKAEFHRNGFRYYVTVKKGNTSREELIQIIENMKPVGPETLRKS